MPPLLGSIADDFTGATDLAGMLVKQGMRTVQMIGVPQHPAPEGLDVLALSPLSYAGAPARLSSSTGRANAPRRLRLTSATERRFVPRPPSSPETMPTSRRRT